MLITVVYLNTQNSHLLFVYLFVWVFGGLEWMLLTLINTNMLINEQAYLLSGSEMYLDHWMWSNTLVCLLSYVAEKQKGVNFKYLLQYY